MKLRKKAFSREEFKMDGRRWMRLLKIRKREGKVSK